MVADFETNYDQANNTASVWSACYKVKGEEPKIFRRISDFINFISRCGDVECYFHNLKFDGEFILNYLARNSKFKMAFDEKIEKFKKPKELHKNEYSFLISDKGVWYALYLKTKTGLVRFMDSMKKAPMSLADAGHAFATKHKKLDMDFNCWMDSDKPLTKKQEDYIKNDVWVMEEFLDMFEQEGHTAMTIGSCALKEYKRIISLQDYKMFFPKISDEEWEFTNKCYHGAFVFVNPKYKGKVIRKKGKTADVNSLYPYEMHSSSGNFYPVGKGNHWIGKKEKTKRNTMDFIHFRCSFRVRRGKLPFVHIRNNPNYPAKKVLETSWIWDRKNETWISDIDGSPIIVDMYMVDKEFRLFLEHYHVRNLEIVEGYTYYKEIGLFDDYINYFNKIKMQSKGGKRQIAKLFLNNLYGKFATKKDSSFKIIDLQKTRETGVTVYKTIKAQDKDTLYMPVGACVTSYALIKIVKDSQKYYEKDLYLYTDTDSIHYIDDIKAKGLIDLDDKKLGAYKIEKEWEEAVFLRAKTYVEKSLDKDGKAEYAITCAGMPERCKQLFRISLGESRDKECFAKLKPSEDGERFMNVSRKLEDFNVGLKVPDKLTPKHVIGGIALLSTEFTIKNESEYGRICV